MGKLAGCHSLDAKDLMNDTATLGQHDSHIQRRSFQKGPHDRQMTCARRLHSWACIISAGNQSISTPSYKAVSSTTLSAPTCKPNAKDNKLFRDQFCASTCNRTEEYSRIHNPVTIKNKVNLICILDPNTPMPHKHGHQIWLNVSNPLSRRKHFLLKSLNSLGP